MNEHAPELTADSLLELIESHYEDSDRLADFKEEQGVLRDLCSSLIEELAPLSIVKPLGIGSTALVFEVLDSRLNRKRALKLPRPKLGKIDNVIKVIRGERSLLAGLNHQNVIKVHLVGEIQIKQADQTYEFPYFLMDFIDGVMDLDVFIKKNQLSSEQIIILLRGLANGLHYLHKNRIIHCDIKPANLLVSPSTPPLITDLGYAKNFPPSLAGPHDETTVTYTYFYAHPDLKLRMNRVPDPDAAESRVEPTDLREAFDLYAFGKTIQKILRDIREIEKETRAESRFSPYEWRYLQMISARLLDGKVERQTGDPLDFDLISGLPPKYMDEVKYQHAGEVVEDFDKFLNVYDLEAEVPELSDRTASYIQVPSARVPMTRRVREIINHPAVARLAQVTQLGFISLVYPGAMHSRFEHTLGVFQQCCELLRALWHDQHNGFFRSIMSSDDLSAVLAAALLHDIGQYPMAHDLSEMAPEFNHENFTEALIFGVTDSHGFTIADILQDVWRIDPTIVTSILFAGKDGGLRTRLLHSIVSGPLDCDKLDYLVRDGIHAGVVFGRSIDRGRLYRNLTTAIRGQDNQTLEVAEIGVTEKALAVADSIWRVRRDMFRQVYWHHSARSLKAMLAYVVRSTLIVVDEAENGEQDFLGEFLEFVKAPMRFHNHTRQAVSDQQSTAADNLIDQDDCFIGPLESSGHSFGSTYLAASDEALLDFLEPFAPDSSQEVISMIRERRLYKRWKVFTYSVGPGHAMATEYYDKFRSLVQVGSHPKVEEWREQEERDLLVELKERLGEEGLATIQAETQAPLVLLDVPVKSALSSGTGEALYYVPEEELRLSPGGGIRLPRPTNSRIEVRRELFDKDVGKIRILVHPMLYEELIKVTRVFET